MKSVFVVLGTVPRTSAQAVQDILETTGSRVTHRYGPRAMIIDAEPEVVKRLASHQGVVGVFEEAIPEEIASQLDAIGQVGAAAWSTRQQSAYQLAKRQRKGEGVAWDHPDYEKES
jgi:hypothetical protein